MPKECPEELRPLVEKIKREKGEMTRVETAKLVKKIQHRDPTQDSRS
jgi:hypothetical protein